MKTLLPTPNHVSPSKSVPFMLSTHMTNDLSDEKEAVIGIDSQTPISRFHAVRLSLIASLPGKRFLSKYSHKQSTKASEVIVNGGEHQEQNMTNATRTNPLNQGGRGISDSSSRTSLYAQRGTQRPISHFLNISKAVGDETVDSKHVDKAAWRHSVEPSAHGVARWSVPSSDGCSSTCSSVTRSSSCCSSSSSSVVASQQPHNVVERGQAEPSKASTHTFACSPGEPQRRGIVGKKAGTRRAMTFSGPITQARESLSSLGSQRNLAFTSGETKLFKPLAPVRAHTMFTSNQRRKEIKAISYWHHTVSQLLMDTLPPTLSPREPERAASTLTPKDFALCKFVMNELYTTELSYCKFLTFIRDHYMEPMLVAAKNKSPWVKVNDVTILFRHLPDMVRLSNAFVKSLECYATSMWRDVMPVQLGRMFRAFEQDMVVFLKYAVHYQTNIKAIRRASSSVLFLKLEQECRSSRDTNRMGIADYLIAPFQRVPRYCLLIKDLIKHSQCSDSQPNDLDMALKILTGLVVAMDRTQK